MVRVFANGLGDLGSIPGRVIPKTQKMILDAALLNIQHYKEQINPGKGVVPSPTPWCSSYGKGSLQVTLDYGCQLYFTYLYLIILIILKLISFISEMFNFYIDNVVGKPIINKCLFYILKFIKEDISLALEISVFMIISRANLLSIHNYIVNREIKHFINKTDQHNIDNTLNHKQSINLFYKRRCPHGVMVKAMDYG